MKPICWKGKRFKACSFSAKYKKAGRNSSGRITIFHRGGGAKRLLRRIDFKRNKLLTGIVERIEYDPNRSARIALVRWECGASEASSGAPNLSDNTSFAVDLSQLHPTKLSSFVSQTNYGYFSYILASDRLKVGDAIMNSSSQTQLELKNHNSFSKGQKVPLWLENTAPLAFKAPKEGNSSGSNPNLLPDPFMEISQTVQRLDKKGKCQDFQASEFLALNDKINNGIKSNGGEQSESALLVANAPWGCAEARCARYVFSNPHNNRAVLKDGSNFSNSKTQLLESALPSGPFVTKEDKAIESLCLDNKSPELKAKEWRNSLCKTAWQIASSVSVLGRQGGVAGEVVDKGSERRFERSENARAKRARFQEPSESAFFRGNPKKETKALFSLRSNCARFARSFSLRSNPELASLAPHSQSFLQSDLINSSTGPRLSTQVLSLKKDKSTQENLGANHLLPSQFSDKMFQQVGNSLPLGLIPLGTFLHNIEERPGQGGKLVRAAGTFAQLVQKFETRQQSLLRLPSGILKLLDSQCRATIGMVSNSSHNTRTLTKAGQNRWLGKRPIVRGVAMNPIDHPHGGGEGRTKGGRPSVSPWGKPSKGGFKTVIGKKKSN